LAAARAIRRRSDRDLDDVLDPIGRRSEVHQAVGDQIAQSLIPMVQVLSGTGADGPSAVAQRVTERT
jgi:hypothetical protein